VDPSTVKVALVGPRRRGDAASKHDMIVAAVNMGWTVANHHQADACGVALAVFSHITRADR
jgi:hypothetical protein